MSTRSIWSQFRTVREVLQSLALIARQLRTLARMLQDGDPETRRRPREIDEIFALQRRA